MSRRVFPLRVVAAADVAAGLAHPQVHPAHPERQALLAALAETGRLRVEGDGTKVGELLGLLDDPDPNFPIVTP